MGKGSKPRPLSVERDTFADRWAQTFGAPHQARRQLTVIMRDLCPACMGDGRGDHPKNACPECGGDGKLKEAA